MNENKIGSGHSSNDEMTIDLYSIILDVLKEWDTILLLTLSALIISYVLLTHFHPLDYSSSATMVISTSSEEDTAKVSSGSDVYETMSYGADSAQRLKNILESKELKATVAKELGLDRFHGSVSANPLGESNLLRVTVSSKSPYISFKEAESVLENYGKFSEDLVGGTELTVLERPVVPERPSSPRQNMRYALYCGALVFVAICALFALLSFMRDTVHNTEEVETKLDTKHLATIMHESKRHKGRKKIGNEKTSILITDPLTSFQYAEDMRKLATRILNEMSEKGQKVLLVSSAAENEGKSTVSVNIALAMAQIDKRVVLVDMDFRKPSLHKILNMQNAEFMEFSTFLEESKNVEPGNFSDKVQSLLCKVPGSDLSVVFNRKAVPQAAERHSELIGRFLEELKQQADYIIIDTAPNSLVSDAEELAGLADTSVIVVRQHWMEASVINDTIDALGGREHVLGCVFNNAYRSRMSGATSGYGYGYGYGYGGHYAK